MEQETVKIIAWIFCIAVVGSAAFFCCKDDETSNYYSYPTKKPKPNLQKDDFDYTSLQSQREINYKEPETINNSTNTIENNYIEKKFSSFSKPFDRNKRHNKRKEESLHIAKMNAFYSKLEIQKKLKNEEKEKRKLQKQLYKEKRNLQNIKEENKLREIEKERENESFNHKIELLSNFISKYKRLPNRNDPFFDFLQKYRKLYHKENLESWKIDKFFSLHDNIFSDINNVNSDLAMLNYYFEHQNLRNHTFTSNLSGWKKRILIYFNQNKLSTEQINSINEKFPTILNHNIKFYERKNKTWFESYTIITDFLTVNGRLPNYKENSWFYLQKSKFNKGKLSQEKIDLLRKLDNNYFI